MEGDARDRLLTFLDWESDDEGEFGQDVRIVLASAEFSKEITTTVMWLNDKGVDIRCVRMRPYRDGEKTLVDIQQVIPLPEAEEYQVQLRNKARQEQESRHQNRDFTKFLVTVTRVTTICQSGERSTASCAGCLMKESTQPT